MIQDMENRLNTVDVLVAQNAQLIADNAQLIAEKGNLITTNAQLIAQIQTPGNCCIPGPPGPQGPQGIHGPPGQDGANGTSGIDGECIQECIVLVPQYHHQSCCLRGIFLARQHPTNANVPPRNQFLSQTF